MERTLQPISSHDDILAAQAADQAARQTVTAPTVLPMPSASPLPPTALAPPASAPQPTEPAYQPAAVLPGPQPATPAPQLLNGSFVQAPAPGTPAASEQQQDYGPPQLPTDPALAHQGPVLAPVTPDFAVAPAPTPTPTPTPTPIQATSGFNVPQISGMSPDAASVTTGQDASAYFGASASSNPALQHTASRARLPVGVLILGGLTLLVSIIHFLNPSSTNAVVNVAIVLDALLAIGLLSRSNLARQIFVLLAIITVIVGAIDIIGLQHLKNLADNKAGQISELLVQQSAHGTPTQSEEASKLQKSLDTARKTADHALVVASINIGVVVLIDAAEAIYLLRPKVRAAFNRSGSALQA